MGNLKRRIFQIIQPAQSGDMASRIFDLSIIGLILLNVALVFASTFNLPPSAAVVLNAVEDVSVIIFTLEYIARLWTADALYPSLPPAKSRLKYIFSGMALVDLLAILPFYLPLLFPIDLRVLRAIRIIRLLRLFKLNRYTTALHDIADVFRRKAAQLISSMIVVSILIVIASLLMYNAEHDAQPEVFQNAFSGIWWAVATLTTVGYGDIYPVTALGKVMSAIIALLGIGLVAVPTGIISAGFTEQIEHKNDDDVDDLTYCPHCGKRLK